MISKPISKCPVASVHQHVDKVRDHKTQYIKVFKFTRTELIALKVFLLKIQLSEGRKNEHHLKTQPIDTWSTVTWWNLLKLCEFPYKNNIENGGGYLKSPYLHPQAWNDGNLKFGFEQLVLRAETQNSRSFWLFPNGGKNAGYLNIFEEVSSAARGNLDVITLDGCKIFFSHPGWKNM